MAEAKIPAASTFRSLDVAERVLYQALRSNRVAIESWARTAAPGARRAFSYVAGEPVGQGVVRATGKLVPMSKMSFVLKMERYNGKVYYILTAFPVP